MKKTPIYKLCDKKNLKTKIGITIDAHLLEIIDDEAIDDNVTRSEKINRILKDYYKGRIK
jgi:metal-responsive CopG/Arc/MetJ family transcriptional regulator